MTLLERYILRRAFLVFAGTLAITMAIVWTTQALGRINLVTDSGQSIGTFLALATLILPSTVPEVVPFAVLIAAVHTLATMNTDSELIVIHAAGSSRSTTIKPVLILAIGAAIGTLVVQNFVDPLARRELKAGIAAARADLLSSVVQEGVFRKIEEGLFVQVGERLSGGQLGSVFIVDSRQPKTELVYYAKEALVTGATGRNLLLMNQGELHRKTGDGDVSIIRFDAYAFDLGAFAPNVPGGQLPPDERILFDLFNPGAEDLHYQDDPLGFRARLHKRLTEWLYPLAFALIALAVAADPKSHREARIHPLFTAMALALAVRWSGFFSAGEARTSSDFIPAMYAVPVLASAVCIYFIVSHRVLELPVALADRLVGAARFTLSTVLRPFGRRAVQGSGRSI
ncbi:MAG: LPS export ABC transporter permease LptF [Rhizobiaceae bacterium]